MTSLHPAVPVGANGWPYSSSLHALVQRNLASRNLDAESSTAQLT